MIVIDVQGPFARRSPTDRTEAVLRRKLCPIDVQRYAVEPLAERVAVALTASANPRPSGSPDIPVRVLLVKGMPALAMRLFVAPVLLQSELLSRLSASSKCFFSSLDVIRV